MPLINWKMFFNAWKIQGEYLKDFPLTLNEKKLENWVDNIKDKDKPKAEEAISLYREASEIMDKLRKPGKFDGAGIIRFEKAIGEPNSFKVKNLEFPMLRQQLADSDFLSCADFVGENDYLGFFAVTAGRNIQNLIKEFELEGDTYRSLIAQTLADRIVEASSEWLQLLVSENYMEVKIRPAWGYPMLPDQLLIHQTKELLPYEDIGVILTENGAMYPPSSISGLYISNPDAKYFMVGKIGEDQMEDYAVRRSLSIEKVKDLLRQI